MSKLILVVKRFTSIYSDYFHWLHLWNTSTEDIKFKKDLSELPIICQISRSQSAALWMRFIITKLTLWSSELVRLILRYIWWSLKHHKIFIEYLFKQFYWLIYSRMFLPETENNFHHLENAILQAHTRGGGWYPSMHWGRPSRRLLLREVRILLECILGNHTFLA